MAPVYSAIYHVQEPICAVQRQSVVSFTPIILNLFKLCPNELTLHQYFAVYSIYQCHGQALKIYMSGGYTLNKSAWGSLEIMCNYEF